MINSKKFKNFKEFVDLFEDSVKMTIDRQKALRSKDSILNRYSINNYKNYNV